MTLLHAHFTLRNQQAFQRLLDASKAAAPAGHGHGHGHGQSASNSGALSSSAGKSWTRSTTIPPGVALDVNAKDWLGRTVLHLACAAVDASALEYAKLLLTHPSINANAFDSESHWTPLHRALYNGNVAAAMLLLQRFDVDAGLKDLEGYTAFDLYNSTVEGTKPPADFARADLYTWGTNRNATLGVADGNDRIHPEQVIVRRADETLLPESRSIAERFDTIGVKDITMSKLHTTLLTDEPRGNLRTCGFGSGGRLGPAQHTQYTPAALPSFTHTITAIAVGQDHTLALTMAGSVLSWGMNQYAQLGYVLDGQATQSGDPRRVYGPLKKEDVRGVACSRSASACWTGDTLFTWGTNHGQLGYDNTTQSVQVLPRKVTGVSERVIGMAMTDSAMCCLLASHDVVCFRNNRSSKINFPTQSFPTEIHTYRPPQAVHNASIAKVTTCDGVFAALSSNGEVFTFTVPLTEDVGSRDKPFSLKPQRIWALRKQWSAVKDLALGPDGSLILCTESGHVFVRVRSMKSAQGQTQAQAQAQGGGKTLRFHRVAYLQRVVKVAANSTGAYAALRVDAAPPGVGVGGTTLARDVAAMMPFLGATSDRAEVGGVGTGRGGTAGSSNEGEERAEEELDDAGIRSDILEFLRLCDVVARDKVARKEGRRGLFEREREAQAHGADIMLSAGMLVPAHRVILAARCAALVPVLSGTTLRAGDITLKLHSAKGSAVPRIVFTSCQTTTVLLFLMYLYSDRLVALWDPRIGMAVGEQLAALKVKPAQIKAELQSLAKALALSALSDALERPVRLPPAPTLSAHLGALFDATQLSPTPRGALAADTILQLADRQVFCHSVVLRSRTSFFASFFDEKEWTAKRWTAEGVVTVQMRHLSWRVMSFVLRYVYTGVEDDLFKTLDFVKSTDDIIEFAFQVVAAANELLLDGLTSLCSRVILRYVTLNNVASVLSEATFYHAIPLVRSLQRYIATSMETLLESRMLDDLNGELVKQLGAAVRSYQAEKLPISRSGRLVEHALAANAEWVALQDIPQPIVRASRGAFFRESPKLSPMGPSRISRRASNLGLSESLDSPSFKPQSPWRSPHALPVISADEMFVMDEVEAIPAFDLDQPALLPLMPPLEPAPRRPSAWNDQSSSRTPKVDLKSIMAETSTSRVNASTPPRLIGFEPPPSGSLPRQTPSVRKASGPLVPETSVPPSPTRLPPRDPSSPWKISSAPQNNPPPRMEPTPPSNVVRAAVLPTRPPPAPTPPRPASFLGPVISPSRQLRKDPSLSVPSGISMTRSSSTDAQKAWTVPPVQPLAAPSASNAQLSFADIQQQQADQGITVKDNKRTLKEIQEEERAQQEEARFIEWWAAEEERIRLETEQALAASTAPPASKPKKARPNRNRGKGQGNPKQANTRTANQAN